MKDLLIRGYVKGQNTIKKFVKDERGDIVQTGMIIAIFAIIIIAAFVLLREPLLDLFETIANKIGEAGADI